MPVGTRLIKIKIGTAEITAECTKAVITSKAADPSLQTFAAAAAGGARVYMLEITAQQNPETATSVWAKAFTAAGTSVPYVFNPWGTATATVALPFYGGNVTITEPDGDFLGGQANNTVNMRQLLNLAWECDGKPTLITTGAF